MKLSAPPKSFINLLGPGLVLIAMGLGSGEFVLWPYLTAQYGLGILWGALVGILLQYIVSNETGRFTLATDRSVFVGFAKLFRFFPYWFILSTFLSFIWPGIIASSGDIFAHILGLRDHRPITIFLLISIGLLLTFGGKVYERLETVQKFFLTITLPLLIIIAIIVVNPGVLLQIPKSLIGIGEGYLFFPAGLVIGQFLGAIAYSGAGGNLILSHSFYIGDKCLGQEKNNDKVVGISLGQKSFVKSDYQMMDLTTENISNFHKWFGMIAKEQFVSFFLIGIFTMILLALISFELIYKGSLHVGNDLSFLFKESELLSRIFAPLGTIFLLVGGTFLFTTQLGVFESTSRIMSENLLLISHKFQNISRSQAFYGFLWLQIFFSLIVTILNIAAPLEILFLNTIFSAISMFVLSGAILWLNNSKILPKELRPSLLRNLFLALSFVFFGIFVFVVLIG